MGDTAVIAAQPPEEAACAIICYPGGRRRAGSDYRRLAQAQFHRVGGFCIDRAAAGPAVQRRPSSHKTRSISLRTYSPRSANADAFDDSFSFFAVSSEQGVNNVG
jgi:hypothetical protein